MRGELIRESLHNGERIYGTHVCSLTNPLAAKMQGAIPYDFIFICNEHMPIDRTETAMMCQYYAALGVSPIVRIEYPAAHLAAQAIDAGAQGIVAPYVETVEEVRAVVGAVKYRPIKGKFLDELLNGTRRPAEKTVEFLKRFNRDTYLIIGIESVAAYENLDALMAVPGVDGIFVGPHDLTVSMEIPEEYDNPAFTDVVKDIIHRARAAGLGFGAHFNQVQMPDERFLDYMREGMNWVLYGSDITVLLAHMPASLEAFRARMGDTYLPGTTPSAQAASCLTTRETK